MGIQGLQDAPEHQVFMEYFIVFLNFKYLIGWMYIQLRTEAVLSVSIGSAPSWTEGPRQRRQTTDMNQWGGARLRMSGHNSVEPSPGGESCGLTAHSGKTVGRSQVTAPPLFIDFQTFCFFMFIFLGIFVGNSVKHPTQTTGARVIYRWGPGNRLSGAAGSAHTVYNVMRFKGEGAGLTSSRPGCR